MPDCTHNSVNLNLYAGSAEELRFLKIKSNLREGRVETLPHLQEFSFKEESALWLIERIAETNGGMTGHVTSCL